MANTNEPIILGSGNLFFADIENIETATEEEIELALIKVGEIESGATIKYEPEIKQIRGGSNNRLLASYTTSEDVTFNTGIITFDLEKLQLLAPATYTKTMDDSDPEKVVKKIMVIGGQNRGVPKVTYLRFVHDKKYESGQIIVNIAKAQNISGFEMEFHNENPTVIGHEFVAQASPDGTLVEIIETFE